MKVQSTSFTPAKAAYKGVQQPSTRRVSCDFDLSGTMYLSSPTGPQQLEESHAIAAITQALTAVLPADSTPFGAPPISVTATVEDTDLGDDPDNPVTPQSSELDGNRRLSKTTENHLLIAVSGHRRKLGHSMLSGSTDTFVEVTGELGQAHDVVTLSKVAFSTLDRDVASAAGLAALLTASHINFSILPHSAFPLHLLAYATRAYTRSIHTAGRCIPRGAWQCALRARLQLRHGCGHHLGQRHTYAH